MDIILLERVEKLGQMGDVVRVRPGFARNFLIPQRKALRATKSNLALFQSRRAQLEADNLARKVDADAIAVRMQGLAVVVVRQAGETGILYGSVSARDLAELVTEAGFTVDRTQILIDRPIKAVGLHEVKVRLHPEVTVTVTANVARSADEARLQSERGGAINLADIDAAERAEQEEAMRRAHAEATAEDRAAAAAEERAAATE